MNKSYRSFFITDLNLFVRRSFFQIPNKQNRGIESINYIITERIEENSLFIEKTASMFIDQNFFACSISCEKIDDFFARNWVC